MEAPALCLRLLMNVVMLLAAHDHHGLSAQKTDLRIDPDRLQFFEYDSFSVSCEGVDSTGWRVVRKIKGIINSCPTNWETSKEPSCSIENAYAAEGGEYWCEAGEEDRSNTVTITVTKGAVILESPVLPVMEGDAVTLRCRNKTTPSNLPADFYKDGILIRTGSRGEMTIHSVSRSDEGLYKCSISDSDSPESRLAVRDGSMILESPVLPVMEGDAVTLRCRTKTTPSNLPADFYKDGVLIRTESTGEMTIHSVSRSDEGLYKCNTSHLRESPVSWLAVRELPPLHLLSLRIGVIITLLAVLTVVVVLFHHYFTMRTQRSPREATLD